MRKCEKNDAKTQRNDAFPTAISAHAAMRDEVINVAPVPRLFSASFP